MLSAPLWILCCVFVETNDTKPEVQLAVHLRFKHWPCSAKEFIIRTKLLLVDFLWRLFKVIVIREDEDSLREYKDDLAACDPSLEGFLLLLCGKWELDV